MPLKDSPEIWATYQKKWRKNNPEKVREIKRRAHKKHPEHRISQYRNWYRRKKQRETNYYELFEKQNGGCAICKKPPTGKDLNRDHSHASGKWRGLLCFKCNAGLGLFEDNPELLQYAIDYLREYSD